MNIVVDNKNANRFVFNISDYFCTYIHHWSKCLNSKRSDIRCGNHIDIIRRINKQKLIKFEYYGNNHKLCPHINGCWWHIETRLFFILNVGVSI